MRDKPVTPGELFALLWILGVFLTRPFRQTPWIFTFTLDSISSLRRVAAYLEKPSSAGGYPVSEAPLERSHESPPESLEVRGLTLRFGDQTRLRQLDVKIEAGEFVAVVGEVGSGKSLFVLSLMGETGAQFNEFKINGENALTMDLNERRKHFAFVPQEGFVMSASLRENIAFEYDVPSTIDSEIIRSLALAQFNLAGESVRDGLNTDIGERGVNLSGGQRQRVSLARAHYFDRPVLLLDDCLSAVDVDTESKLLENLIAGAWRHKTRILVTHRLSVLSQVDRVLFMRDGRVIESGKFSDLLEHSADVREFVASVQRSEAAQNGALTTTSTQEGETIDALLENATEAESKTDSEADGSTEGLP